MAEQIKIFDFSFGNTVESITKLKAELKETRKAFEDTAAGSAQFKQLGGNVKSLEGQIKTLTAVTKENQNALGGINTASKFAAGSYGELKQRIEAQKKALLELNVESEEFLKVQNDLIKSQEQRIAIEAKIPSLFKERIKSAIDESNSLKQLKIDLKAAQAAALNGDGAAAQRVAELKDQMDDLKDSTQTLQGSGVERLQMSMAKLTEGFQNFDTDKIKTGFKGIGAAMSAIPLILIIEGIKALIENFDKISEYVKIATNSFSAAEQNVRSLTKASEANIITNKALTASIDNQIAILTAQGHKEKEIVELKKQKIKVQIAEAEDIVRLNAAKAAEVLLNDGVVESIQRIQIALLRKTGEDEQANVFEAAILIKKKERIKEELNLIRDAQIGIAASKTALQVLDIEVKNKEVATAKEKNKTIADLEKDRQAREAEVGNKEADDYDKQLELQKQRQKDAAAATLKIEDDLLNDLATAERKYYSDKVARAETELYNVELNGDEYLAAELAVLDARREQDLANTELTEAERALIVAKYRKQEEELEREAITASLERGANVTNSLANLSDALFDAKRANLQKGSAEDIEAARNQFELNKAFSIASTLIQGTSAIINAAASVPFLPVGLAASVAVGANVAASLAKISSTQFQYFDGGYTGEGNPRDESTNLGARSYTYHKDEYITPSKVLNTAEGSFYVSKLEAMRKGVSKTNISGFYDGGYTARQAGANATDNNNMLNNIMAAIQSQPAPVVRVTDINNVSRSNEQAISVSGL